MKHIILTLAFLCSMCCSAQEVGERILQDIDGDGSFTIADVTVLIDNYLNGTTKSITVLDGSPYAGYEYVDLGLSVVWATMNVGATKPQDCGKYFAWGETNTKRTYYWKNYFDTNDNGVSFQKYYNGSGGKDVLDIADDAARANWGGEWRMPTKAEMDELRSKCTCTWTTQNAVNGYLVTSTINGNSIFLPAAGYSSGSATSHNNVSGVYWTNELDGSSSTQGYGLFFNSKQEFFQGYDRYQGRTVRAVNRKPAQVDRLIQDIDGDESFTIADVTVLIDDYLNAKTDIIKELKPFNNGHEYVDLGLSVKWATMNVGATTPEDYGDHFAWGETSPKGTYAWKNLKYNSGSTYKGPFTKYVTSSSYGTIDNKTVLDLSDDAANANWGGNWRMPTDSEITELRTKCTWIWTTSNGVKGYEVTSKTNGNSIFLPAAGSLGISDSTGAGSYGYYWSSSLDVADSYRAYELNFKSGTVVGGGSNYRWIGQSVRAVCP